MTIASCPNCGGRNLYQSDPVGSGGGHAPNYLPGLGEWYKAARFRIVLCQDCGQTRFFASREAAVKASESKRWTRVV